MDGSEDATQGNEFLAWLFDGLYNDLSDDQRQVMIKSLEWRIDHWMNSFAWRAKGRSGPLVRLTFRKGKEHLGDQRLDRAPAPAGREIDWRAPVAEGATGVEVELFNYYRKGTVSWSGMSVRAGGDGNLLTNGDFAERAEGKPAAWRFNRYGTNSSPVTRR